MKIDNTFRYHLLLAVVIIVMDFYVDYVFKSRTYFLESFTLLGIIFKITYYTAFFSVYALNYRFISPRTLPKGRLLLFGLGVITLFFVFAGVRYLLEEIIVYQLTGYHNYPERNRTFQYYILDSSYYSLKSILFSTVMYLLFLYLRNSSKMHRLELEHQKAELDILKAQLEPHFLFNTLNVFYSELAEKQPETAKGIFKLSELLRYLTYEAKKDFVPLKKELKFIEDYIYLYQKRFENNLFLNLSIEGEIGSQKLPSLILIHFVENIFKHGITNEKRTPAKIEISVAENYLVVHTENKISNVKNYSTTGIGKENLKKRLQLLFGKDYELSSNALDNMYSTYLKIPLK
ncbi:sensor histidine kinase [Croceitalea marina]|uniref:Sensor histidine kinase n=1 Tax=Croceitalea marina TaxID=1775166 RepID=A0ABW5N1Q6_9FLAO